MRHNSPKQLVRCKTRKRYILPQQIEGPPRLRTSCGTWAALELFALKKKGSKLDAHSLDAKLVRLGQKAKRGER